MTAAAVTEDARINNMLRYSRDGSMPPAARLISAIGIVSDFVEVVGVDPGEYFDHSVIWIAVGMGVGRSVFPAEF